jgi:hypothetical protein
MSLFEHGVAILNRSDSLQNITMNPSSSAWAQARTELKQVSTPSLKADTCNAAMEQKGCGA